MPETGTGDKAITDCLYTIQAEINDWYTFGDLPRNRAQAARSAGVMLEEILRGYPLSKIEERLSDIRSHLSETA